MSTIIHVSDHRAGVAYMQAECGGCQAVGPRVECGLKYDPDAAALARSAAKFYEYRAPRLGKRGQVLRGYSIGGLCRACAAGRLQTLGRENGEAPWSDPHVSAVERWLVDSTAEMPEVLRG